MFDVIGIGSVFVDYFFDIDGKTLKKYRLKPEDDFLFQDVRVTPGDILKELPYFGKNLGGNSLNTTVTLGALSKNVSYYGLVGKDEEGKYFIDNLNKVDKSHLIESGNTPRCMCLLSHRRKYRTFLSEVNKKDNTFFMNIDFNFLNKAKLIHVGPFALNPKKNIKELEKIFMKTKKPLISFSPGIMYINLKLKALQPLLKKTHILFLNRDEINALTNKDEKKGSKYLLEMGPKIVVCTMGKEGAIVTTEKKQFLTKAVRVKKIVDTTGAGDTFAAGFLYGLLNNKSLKWSAEFANKIASKCITDYGLRWLNKIRK